MALWFPLDYFSKSEVEYFKKKSTFVYMDRYGIEKKTVLYRKTPKGYYFPLGMWEELFDELPQRKFSPVEIECDINLIFRKGISQKDVVTDALKCLTKKGHALLNVPTGSGKTQMSIYTACCLRKKILVVSTVSVTLDQWKEDFEHLTSARPQYLDTKTKVESDVILCTPHTFKIRHEDLQDYGTIIIDEIHLHTSSILKSLLHYRPRYLIGLTATLERGDGLVDAIKLYFRDSIVSREEKKQGVAVHVLKTAFRPQVTYRMVRGKRETDYNDLVNKLCTNRERNSAIADHIFLYLSEDTISNL